jgi:nicotinamidase-related amidase
MRHDLPVSKPNSGSHCDGRLRAVTPVQLDPGRTALILVDLMPRILTLDTAPLYGGEVLRRCTTLAAGARTGGSLVVFVRTERPGVVEQPLGSNLAPECVLHPADVEIIKRTLGAFHQTNLDRVLRGRGIETVALAGLITNFGASRPAEPPTNTATTCSTYPTR